MQKKTIHTQRNSLCLKSNCTDAHAFIPKKKGKKIHTERNSLCLKPNCTHTHADSLHLNKKKNMLIRRRTHYTSTKKKNADTQTDTVYLSTSTANSSNSISSLRFVSTFFTSASMSYLQNTFYYQRTHSRRRHAALCARVLLFHQRLDVLFTERIL